MKELEKRYVDVLESNDVRIIDYLDDGRVELEWYSPAGEDFSMCVEVDDFPRSMSEYAADFDVDEHIAMWIEAKNNGVFGVPSARELAHDAEAIEEFLENLADKLHKEA